ncbi:hypothetical protein FB45DRAFT_903836 [Roridomyces roridus]|uniref:Uncharacterized protein n=1 Tax=Roridomyces roridus TaxID=1738132 RepID=A0AAD7FRI8_9AGAR|nr:hypothetical protein FB45DRAFT_903836 [Roridomyces roridus]
MAHWQPKRTMAEVDAILTAPGSPLEVETRLINGLLQRVYKNQWPSVRDFWLWSSKEYADKSYIVFENERFTYKDISQRAVKAAAMLVDLYSVRKGDRVAICSRNYPEYLVVFWACHLIGAIPALPNAWLKTPAILHCLTLTQCKVIVLDAERATLLEPIIKKLTTEAKSNGVLVFRSREGKGHWKGMQSWDTVLGSYKHDGSKVLQNDPKLVPEDNAVIFFTSGTTGLPKAVLSTHRQYLTNTLNTIVARRRAILRRGEDIPIPSPDDPQPGVLLAVPLFHVTGMSISFAGGKIVFMRKWNTKEAARLIRQEKLTSAGGVPSMSSDLIESELVGYPLDGLSFGGAPTANILLTRAQAAFPNVTVAQGYGLTETNSIATSELPPLTKTDICVLSKEGKLLPPGVNGEIFIRGCNVCVGYWRDPEATAKAITKDGWLASGDLGYMDEEGFVYVRDRIKDIIVRGGENIDSTSVENGLFTEGVLEVAAIGVPDDRLGELVTAVVSVKPEYRDKLTEECLTDLAQSRLPKFAVPVMIVFQDELEKNAAGKIVKAGKLRDLVRREWAKRGRRSSKAKL